MKDLNTGPGTYVRLDQKTELKSGYTIIFGSSVIVFKVSNDEAESTVSFKFI